MAPLIKLLEKNSKTFELKVCVTSQHREMLDQVLEIFEIKPDFDLNLMKNNQNLSNLTSSILIKMQKIFEKYSPDIILVHGDTTTTLAVSIAAFYSSIPVGHVEAGLRTYNLKSPFPEEFNRQIVGKLANLHFAPTALSELNLIREGVDRSKIIVTGNTVIDALTWALKKIQNKIFLKKNIEKLLNENLSFNWKSKKFILITAHRRENFMNGFFEIIKAIKKISLKYPKIHFVYPVHLNPNVSKPVHQILKSSKNIHLIRPLEYLSFIYLLKYSYLVLTDSGGIQEEAPSLGKPVLVMRDVTERPEGVDAGTIKLVGSNQDFIINGVSNLLDDQNLYDSMSKTKNPYGDGFASKRIINFLKKKIEI